MPRSDFVRRHEAAFRDFHIFLVGALGPGSRRVSIGLTNICRATKVFGTKLRGPGSRRVSNGLTNIHRATKVFGRQLRGHVGFVECFCS